MAPDSTCFTKTYKKKVKVPHPVNFVDIINGNFSFSLNETADLSKFIAGLWGDLCFPIPL